MDKYYLEFLDEAIYCLENYENLGWARRMKQSKNKFVHEKDIDYFFSLFGGMGSFSDFLYSETGNLMTVIDVLVDIAYSLANNIKENKSIEILDLLTKIYQNRSAQVEYNNSIQTKDNLLYKKCNYAEYLLNNYELGNLHSITQDYIENLLNNENTK